MIKNKVEQYVSDNDVDIFLNPKYIEHCSPQFLVERALFVVEKKPNRISEVVEKIKTYSKENKEKIFFAFDARREEFFKLLSNVVINEKIAPALFYLPHLYLISLKNDFEKTTEKNWNSYFYKNNITTKSKDDIDFLTYITLGNRNLYKEYLDVLVKNKYLTHNGKTIPLYLLNIGNIATFKTDKLKFLATYEGTFRSDDEVEYIYEEIKDEFKGKEALLPLVFFIRKSVSNRFFNSNQIPIVNEILSPHTWDLKKLEEKFIKEFNIKEKSIDEYVSNLYQKNVNKNDLKIEDKLALTLYIKNKLLENGVYSCGVDLFAYEYLENSDRSAGGAVINDELYIYLNVDCSTKRLMKTIFHEMSHVIQNNNIRELNFEKDSDIDIYYKDILLRNILGNDYYYSNYRKISYEFDAGFKAEMMFTKEFGNVNDTFKKYALWGANELSRNGEYLNEIKDNISYEFSMKRGEKGVYLDDLLASELQNYIDKGKDLKELIDICPLVKFEYDLDKRPIKKRSVKELVDGIVKDPENEGIYVYLLNQKLDKQKNHKYINDGLNMAKCLVGKYPKRIKEELLTNLFQSHPKFGKYRYLK